MMRPGRNGPKSQKKNIQTFPMANIHFMCGLKMFMEN